MQTTGGSDIPVCKTRFPKQQVGPSSQNAVGVDGPEMTTKVSDVELAELTVPDCHAFGRFEETEKSGPTCRPAEALTPPRRQDRRSEKPEKSHKPGAWPAQDVDVTEKRPRCWQD